MEERIRLNPLSHVSANVGGEELDEAPGGPLAGARDHRGEDLEAGAVEVPRWNWDDFLAHGRALS